MTALIKELREISGAGILDCKKALEATDGNIDEALDWLREKGISKAAKKGGRIAAEGLTKVKISGNKAVILELNSETDFVAMNENFQELLEIISTAIVESEAKTLEEALLLETPNGKVEDLIVSGTATIGEKIVLRRIKVLFKTNDQVFGTYSHLGGKISVLSIFTNENDEVTKGVSMHIAAMNPQFLKPSDVSSEVADKEKENLRRETLEEGKPENIVEKIVEGKINKFFQTICLVEQDYAVDPDKKINQLLSDNDLDILDFVRFEVGEGIEKVEDNFAEEVKSKMNA